MSRLRLPHLAKLAAVLPVSPSSCTAPTPVAAVRVLIGRRAFLKAAGAALVVVGAPWTRVERVWAKRRGRFFTRSERRTLEALVDTILPPDGDPGAAELGVARYIEGYLAAFDTRTPRLYAGGPFSGRQPFIDYDDGTPSRRRPRNAFRRFVPPNRLQALYFRWQLFGTDGLSASDRALVAPLDAQLGGAPLRGLRDLYREGLVALDALARMEEGAPFVDLDEAGRARVRDAANAGLPVDARRGKNFLGLVVQHTLEGAFSAPEYGGNRKGAGWRLLGLAGDSQPLGYGLYSRALDDYRERADVPLSTPNPDEVAGAKPLSAEATTILQTIAAGANLFPGCPS